MEHTGKPEKYKIYIASGANGPETLKKIERVYRNKNYYELMPWASGASFNEIADICIPDGDGKWKNPVFFIHSKHLTVFGIDNICNMAQEYFRDKSINPYVDILSISAGVKEETLYLNILVRSYTGKVDFDQFSDYIGEDEKAKLVAELNAKKSGSLKLPDNVNQEDYKYSPEFVKEHNRLVKKEEEIFNASTREHPFLNEIESYTKKKLPNVEDENVLVYDLLSSDNKIKEQLNGSYKDFLNTYNDALYYVNGTEHVRYIDVMNNLAAGAGDDSLNAFMSALKLYIEQVHIETGRFNMEDLNVLMKKLYTALFEFYIIQDLIDDPRVSDIRITAPDSIRCKVDGKAYMSNLTFLNDKDYIRFVNGIVERNGVMQDAPEQTFTDKSNSQYALRITLSAAYISSTGLPALHISKINHTKPMSDDLIRLGMFTPKVRDFLLDCGKYSKAVLFAGPPRSGKSVILNWYFEDAYEPSAEILIIQENDELFAYRKGVMIQHIVNNPKPIGDERILVDSVDLEELGRLALVNGSNVFIIGEAKGGEICSALTLANSGCRVALTLHSSSAVEAPEKMANLAMMGDYNWSLEQAKRAIKNFQTIVYLENFKVQQITEITGYNEAKHELEFRYIYDRKLDKEALEIDRKLEEKRRREIEGGAA